MESDRPLPLIGTALERLRSNGVLAPNMIRIERLAWIVLKIAERRLFSALTQTLTRNSEPKGNWQLGNSIQRKIVAMAFAMAAEIERDLISQRTTEALAGILGGKNVGTRMRLWSQWITLLHLFVSIFVLPPLGEHPGLCLVPPNWSCRPS